MKEQFVPYEQALKLKELGFDEECFTYFKNGIIDLDDEGILEIYKNYDANNDIDEYISSPLWQQAFDWLWNKTGKYIIPIPNDNKEWLCMGNKFKTYEEARLECLKKLIEIAKEQNVK